MTRSDNMTKSLGRLKVLRLAALALGFSLLATVVPAVMAQATSGFIAGTSPAPCKSYAYGCVTGGYAATASSTGNSWAWKYYGEQGAGEIGTPSGPHNCTLYVAWRLQEARLKNDPGNWGNAAQWGNHFTPDKSPKPGSVAWWNGGIGHVAYVEQVSSDGAQVYVRADNYMPTGSEGYTDSGWISTSAPTGFLHIQDITSTPPSTSTSPPPTSQDLVRWGSFENTAEGWSRMPNDARTNIAHSNIPERAHDGNYYLATNTTAPGIGSVAQDRPVQLNGGDSVVVGAWVRAQDGNATGTWYAWALGINGPQNSCTGYSVDNSRYQYVQVTLNPFFAHDTLRIQLYPGTGTTQLDSVKAMKS